LVAPGRYFTAPASRGLDSKALDATGRYRIFDGTSAATPYTAGVIALVLEAHRDHVLTSKQVKERLKASLRHTPGVPDSSPGWGFGKLAGGEWADDPFGSPAFAVA
jgi:subtilisin family serine protease